MNVGGLFDGCGLLAYGLHLAGLEHRWLCEVDPLRRTILGRRWPGVRIFDDVRAVGADTAERVDVIAGGFPCKGASTAGKRNGFDHPETVLWREMARAVGELRPRYVVVENVANILALHDGAVWGEVLGDLAALRYDTVWDCIPAAAFGAPHLRDRIIAIATDAGNDARRSDQAPRGSDRAYLAAAGRPEGADQHRAGDYGAPADAERDRIWQQPESERRRSGARVAAAVGGVAVEWGEYEPAIRRWEAVHGPAPQPLVRRVDDGSTRRVERSRLSALGDGVQVQLGLMVGEFLMSEADRLMGAPGCAAALAAGNGSEER